MIIECDALESIERFMHLKIDNGEPFTQAYLLAMQHILAAIIIIEADYHVRGGTLDNETGEARVMDYSNKPQVYLPLFKEYTK